MGPRSRACGWFRKKMGLQLSWPYDAYYARRAALEKPGEFAALRRNGLSKADRIVAEIFESTRDVKDLVYVVYSNHGEVFDHFRYNQQYTNSTVNGLKMIEGTSHGNYPYEVVYANMQMWIIPNRAPRVMRGIGRSIDFAPTILDLAGIGPQEMDGESMLGCFSEGAFPDRDRYAEAPIGVGCLSMVRDDGYKFISVGSNGMKEDRIQAQRGFAGHRLAVFDLKPDPYEYVNLIDTQQGQEVLEWSISRHKKLKCAS
jgi:arylsulfatase A-like enzyme